MSDNSTEDESQKTEEPSTKKLEKAKKEGNVFMSREVSAFLSFCTFAILLLTAMPWSAVRVASLTSSIFSQIHTISHSQVNLKKLVLELWGQSLIYILPVILVFAAIEICSSLLQHGSIFSAQIIKPQLNRISVVAGFKRIFAMSAIFELIKGIAKIVLVGYSIYFAIKPKIPFIIQSTALSSQAALYLLTSTLLRMLISTCSVMFFVASFDYIYQRLKFMNKMKMTKHEVKEEHKQSEGNPEIRSKIRSMQLQKTKQRMSAIVPKATVVITNPTHYAIALSYDEKTMHSPMVIAKGVNDIALTIREIARENNIPIVENPPLARSLYKEVDLDQYIKQSHYKAVAKIISKIFALQKKKQHSSD